MEPDRRHELAELPPLLVGDCDLQVLNLRETFADEGHDGHVGNPADPGIAEQLRVESDQALVFFCRTVKLWDMTNRGCLADDRFVLQVGAMAHEENADALAESLRQRNFPVNVSRSGTSRLYRVVVGPYNDVDSTLRVKEQLKKQWFEAFRMAWNPSAQ